MDNMTVQYNVSHYHLAVFDNCHATNNSSDLPGRGNLTSVGNDPAIVALRYIVLVLYLLTFVFGVVGNSLTILVILRNKRMKTVATCFILNLAVADDLFMLSLPFMAYSTYSQNWIFGTLLCTVMTSVHKINFYASIFTMVLMSIDRYLAIVHPLSSIRYRTVRNAVWVCIGIWAACCVIIMPFWLYARTGSRRPNNSLCTVYWPKNSIIEHKWFWANFELLVGFIVPIIIMVLCYLKLLKHLITENVPCHDQSRRPIRKVTVMVFIVTIVFVICWTPYHIVEYTNVHKLHTFRDRHSWPSRDEIVTHAVFNTIAQALVFLSSCCNPFIYSISSRNFRTLYASAVCSCCSPVKRMVLLPPTNSCRYIPLKYWTKKRQHPCASFPPPRHGQDNSDEGYWQDDNMTRSVGFERVQETTIGPETTNGVELLQISSTQSSKTSASRPPSNHSS